MQENLSHFKTECDHGAAINTGMQSGHISDRKQSTTTNNTAILMAFGKSKKGDKKVEAEKGHDGEVIYIDPREPTNVHPIFGLRYIGPELILVGLGLIGSAAMGIIPIMLFLILGDIIDAASSGNINPYAAKMAYVAVGAFGAALVQFFFLNTANGRIATRLKRAYFYNLLDQEIGYFDMKRTGELLSGMTEGLEVIQEACTMKMGELVTNLVQLIAGVIVGLVTSWKMALVMLAITPVLAVLLGICGVMVGVIQKFINHRNGQAAAIANEVIGSMRTVRSMDGEEREKKRFLRQLKTNHVLYLTKASTLSFCIGIAIFLNWGDIALGFWWGGRLMTRGEITVGKMFQVFGYIMMAIMAVAQGLLRVLPEFAKSNQSLKELLKVIKRVPALRVSGGVQPEKIEGNITFTDVCFSYPTRPNAQVLKHFSLTITPGQAVALVGASGSGKSTIVGLIEKFYEQDSGTITLDGVDLKEIDPRWLHRNIGIVTQEPTLFATTITENILYAVKFNGREYSQEDVENAARAANAHDFIIALPDGYNTILGERGVSMSGGQKQRIAIARAMIQDPKLLLLDEATSALDTQSESIVQDALNKLMKGRTSIVIAHRLSTVIDCDMICVMNKGELMEKGSHQELIQNESGYYYKLASKQMMNNSDSRSQLSQSESSNDLSSTSSEEV